MELARVAEELLECRDLSALDVRWSADVTRDDLGGSLWACSAPVARPQGFFDLASVSKVFTATLALMLAQRGLVPLNRRVAECLPDAGSVREFEGVTLEDLLRHRAGLKAWWPLYDDGVAWGPACVEHLLDPLRRGAPVDTYSDLSVMLWALAIERELGVGLYELLREHVLEPLGMAGAVVQAASVDPRSLAAPCELDTDVETRLALALGLQCEGPGPPAPGQSQDGNARWFARYTGHAGLWGTADAVYRLGGEWVSLVAGETARLDLPSAAVGAALGGLGRRRLGWWSPMTVVDSEARTPRRRRFEQGYGHTGFVGGSLWIDPRSRSVAALLTHRRTSQVDLSALRLAAASATG